MHEHRTGMCDFTSRYRITRLVYFETTTNPIAAIAREKELKGWLRARKIALVEKDNPKWPDLAEELMPKKAEQQILRCARDDIRASG